MTDMRTLINTINNSMLDDDEFDDKLKNAAQRFASNVFHSPGTTAYNKAANAAVHQATQLLPGIPTFTKAREIFDAYVEDYFMDDEEDPYEF